MKNQLDKTVYLACKETLATGENVDTSFHIHIYAKDVLPERWADLGTRYAALLAHAREFQDVVNAATLEASAARAPLAKTIHLKALRDLAWELTQEANRIEAEP